MNDHVWKTWRDGEDVGQIEVDVGHRQERQPYQAVNGSFRPTSKALHTRLEGARVMCVGRS